MTDNTIRDPHIHDSTLDTGSHQSQKFTGKVIVVTGGSKGMGAAHARAFVSAGGSVVIGDIDDPAGQSLADELGERARYHHLDVSDEVQWAEFMEFTEREFGPISVMVNNAGIGGAGTPVETSTLAGWQKLLHVNLDSVFLGTRAAIVSMKKTGGGSIVNVSSVAGLTGTPLSADYTTSKFAIRGFTKSVAMEVGDDNIRVNSLHPGLVRTPAMGDLGEEVVIGRLAIKRIASSEEVSKMVLFMASDDSSYSTGAEFVMDGGWSAGSPVAVGQTYRHYLDG